jgi:glycosyltransferase involved in cell wall biosynthesis
LIEDVSIVIPTHNSGNTLKACLESVKNQNYPALEVILADNFSEDNTTDIAKEFGITILERCGRPSNPGSARNAGIMKSSGKYSLLLDSDEILAEDVVQKCVDSHKKENAGAIKIPLCFVGSTFWGKCSAFWKNCNYLVNKETIGSIPRFYVKEVILRAGLFNESLVIGEDWELYARMKKNGVKEAYCDSSMLHIEPSSLGRIMRRELQYSRFIRSHSRRFKQEYDEPIYKNSLRTLKEALKSLRRWPALVVGSLFLLFVKTCVWTIRFTFF